MSFGPLIVKVFQTKFRDAHYTHIYTLIHVCEWGREWTDLLKRQHKACVISFYFLIFCANSFLICSHIFNWYLYLDLITHCVKACKMHLVIDIDNMRDCGNRRYNKPFVKMRVIDLRCKSIQIATRPTTALEGLKIITDKSSIYPYTQVYACTWFAGGRGNLLKEWISKLIRKIASCIN